MLTAVTLFCGLVACTEPDPLTAIEAELGEPIPPEDRELVPTELGHYLLVLPDRLVVGGIGWEGFEHDGEQLPEDMVGAVAPRTLPLEHGRVPEDAKRGQLINDLYDALLEHAELHKDLAMRTGAEALEFRGELWVFVDVRVPGSLLREAMFTAGQAQFGNFKLVGVGPRLGSAPPAPPDLIGPPADESVRLHPLSPTRLGMIAGSPRYEVDDRAARIAIDTLASKRSPTMGYDGDQMLAKLRVTPSNPRLYPTYTEAAAAANYTILPSIEMLMHVSKHLDDQMMADLQRAREPIRQAMVDAAIEAASDQPEAKAWLEAAQDLGRGVDNPRTAEFLANPLQSMPVGIYGEHDDLGRIFRRDRWLMQDLGLQQSLRESLTPVMQAPAVARALADERAHRAVWTNPAYKPTIENGGDFFLSGARSHETAWVDAQGGTSAVPEPMDAWIGALQAGDTSIALQDDSGWYDHAQWALEPLLTLPDPIDVGDGYRERLKQAFKTGVALRRETQVKDLALPAIGAGGSDLLSARVAPVLRVEPVPTHFERSAEVYSFLLEHALTTGDLPDQAAWTERIEAMRDLYAGVAALSKVDLGQSEGDVIDGERLKHDPYAHFRGGSGLLGRDLGGATRSASPPEAAEGPPTPPHVERAATWLERWRDDPVLGEDVRVLVPFGPHPDRPAIIGWGVLGVQPVDLVVSYAEPPVVRALAGEQVELNLTENRYTVLVPYFSEVVVPRPLTRTELRAMGDRHPMALDFVRALSR